MKRTSYEPGTGHHNGHCARGKEVADDCAPALRRLSERGIGVRVVLVVVFGAGSEEVLELVEGVSTISHNQIIIKLRGS